MQRRSSYGHSARALAFSLHAWLIPFAAVAIFPEVRPLAGSSCVCVGLVRFRLLSKLVECTREEDDWDDVTKQ